MSSCAIYAAAPGELGTVKPSRSDWTLGLAVLVLSPEKLMTRVPSSHTSETPTVVLVICVRHSMQCQASAVIDVALEARRVPLELPAKRNVSTFVLPSQPMQLCGLPAESRTMANVSSGVPAG